MTSSNRYGSNKWKISTTSQTLRCIVHLLTSPFTRPSNNFRKLNFNRGDRFESCSNGREIFQVERHDKTDFLVGRVGEISENIRTLGYRHKGSLMVLPLPHSYSQHLERTRFEAARFAAASPMRRGVARLV